MRHLKAFTKPLEVCGHILELGTSIGFAMSPAHGAEAEELIASADYTLYRAKAAGGHTICMYETTMRSETNARRELRDELLVALRRDQLELF